MPIPQRYVLVVENDLELQRSIAQSLKEAHYEVSTETEAQWARRSLSVRRPDALVVATELDDGAGYSVAQELRMDPGAADVPIVFLAHRWGAHHEAEACWRFAPAQMLPRPRDVNRLLAKLLSVCPPQGSGAKTRTPVPSVPLSEEVSSSEFSFGDSDQAYESVAVESLVESWAEAAGWHGGAAPPDGSSVDASEQMKLESRSEPARADSAAAAVPSTLPTLMGDAARRGPAPAIKDGQIGQRSCARLLGDAFVNRISGALVFVRGKVKKIVYLQGGHPVLVRSNRLSECLGRVLVKDKRLSAEDLAESLRLMKQTRQRQGEVLLAMGVLSPHGLRTALIDQMHEKLFELFAWKEGHYVFQDAVALPGTPVDLGRSVAAVIQDGVRRAYDSDRLDRLLGAYADYFVLPTQDPRVALQDITSDAVETEFLLSVDGQRTLAQTLASCPVPGSRRRSFVVALLEAGVLELNAQPQARSPGLFARAERPSLSSRSEQELRALLEALHRQTHFEVLSLPTHAAPEEADLAFVKAACGFHPDAYRNKPTATRAVVDEIFDRLAEAHRLLSDPERRRGYLRRLDRARSAPGVSEEAVASAEAAYFAGVSHLKKRRFSQAVEALRSASALVPGQASYHSTLGWAVYRSDPMRASAVAEAESELRRAVEFDPEDPWQMVSLGRFLSETGRIAEALEVFGRALQGAPDVPDIVREIRRLKGSTQ